MGDCFYRQIVAVDSSTDTVPESGASVRRVGDSVGSYLQDSARGSRRRVSDSAGSSSRRGFTDDEIHMLSCSLLSQRRGPRRAFLEATDSSTRRRLIAECKAIHARVQDSCIEYTPEVCWAINAVIENEDPKGYVILKKSYKSLPEEVKRFYNAFVENRYSVEAQEAQSLLGPYRLVQDDERVTAFLEGGTTQEDALNDVVEEASVAGEELYEDALDALDALSDQAAIMAQDFATEVAAMYTNGLGDIVAGQVSGGAEEASEEIVDNPPVEADVESEDDPAQDDDEVVEETTSVEVGDSAPARVSNMKRVRTIRDSKPCHAPNRRVRVVTDDAADSSSPLDVSQLVFSSDIDASLEDLSDGLSVLYRGDGDSIIHSMREVLKRIFSFIDAINSVVNDGRVDEEGIYEYYDSDSSMVVGYGLGMDSDDILLSLYPTRSYAKSFPYGSSSYAFVGDGSDWKSPVMKACLAILSRLDLSNDQSVLLKNRLRQAVSDSLDALALSSTRSVVDSSVKKYAENKRSSKSVVDVAPKHRVANKRVKDSCAAPSLPLPVGSSVQVSYLGNLYTGVITSVGDGSVIVSGLPIEYFNVRAENGAFTGSDADYTFASTDVVVLPADGSPVALDGPSSESEVVVEENTVEELTPDGGYVPSIMMDDDEKIEDAIGNTPFEQELRGILRDGCVGHEDDDVFDIPLVADFSLHVDGSNPNNISAHVFEGTVDCGGLMIPTGGLSDDEKGILFVDKVTEFIKEKLGPQVFTLVDLDDVFRTSDSALSDDIILKNVEALESILPDVSGGMPKSAVITVLGSDGNFHDGTLILEPNPNTDSEVHYTLKGVGRPKQGIVGLNLMDNDGDWRTVAFDLARYLAPRKFNVSDSAVDLDDVFCASDSTTYDDVIRKNIEALESILPEVSGGATKSTDITVLKSDGRFYEGTLVLRPDFNSESNVHYVLRGVGRRMEGNIGLNLMDNEGDWRTVASDLAHYFAPQKFYVSDSAVDFNVDSVISAVWSGVDVSNSDSSVGIFYDGDSDNGADASIAFVSESGVDMVPVSKAAGYLSSHIATFKDAISNSADAISAALGSIGPDVAFGSPYVEDAAGDGSVSNDDSLSVSEEIIEEQGVSETGSPEAIDWGAVGDTCRQWVLDNSFKLAQEPTDANLQTACELLSAGLEVLHLEVRFDPSVPRILCKNQRFIDVRPDGAYVGTIAFFYQTSDSAISKFASDFSDAAVQLAHKIYDIPEVSDSAPTSVDGSYVDFESKDGLLRALDAVHAGGDDFRYVRVEDDEDGKFIVAMADTFGRDKKYMSEDGETSDRSEAVRFSDKREAFERLKQLIKDGKITYSLFNTWPEEVMDDDSLLSDAAKQEVLHSIENEIKKALEEKEILVEDSIVVKIDVDRVQDGAPNTFDIPHTASTFRRIRNTKRVLDSVLGVASDVLGERLTPSVYKSLCKSGSRAAKAKVSKVMDSALAMDALDLYCPDIYKRKLSDSYWVCDDVQKVADSFKLDGLSGASGSCLVSTTPFDESLSAGKQVTCFKCGSKSDIYILIV